MNTEPIDEAYSILYMPPIRWWSDERVASYCGVKENTVRKWRNGSPVGSDSHKILNAIIEDYDFRRNDIDIIKKVIAMKKIMDGVSRLLELEGIDNG